MTPGAQAAAPRRAPFRSTVWWCLGCFALVLAPPLPGETLAGESEQALGSDEGDAPVTETEIGQLLAATPIQGELAMGETRRFRFAVPDEGRWLVRVDQLGVDLALRLSSAKDITDRFDSPLDRDGVELVLLPAGGAKVQVHLESLSQRPGGAFRLRVDRVGPEEPVEALEHWTRGAAAYARGGGEGQRLALDEYRMAGELWQAHRRPRLAAQAIYTVAVLHRLLGEVTEARGEAERVLPLWRAFGDLGREADTLNEIGLLDLRAGRPDAARQRFREALAIQERLGDGLRQSPTANNLCLTHLYEGEHAPAVECYGQVLETIRGIGDSEHEAVALTNLGWAHSNLGQPAEALAAYQSAARLHREAGREKRHAETLNALAVLHRNLDEPGEALRLYLQALDIFRRAGDRGWEARVLHNLGTVYQRLGDRQRARVFLQRALDLRRQLGDRPGEATGWRALGLLELEERDPEAALEALDRSLVLELATDDRHGAAATRSLLGFALAEQGSWDRALDEVSRALLDLRQLGDSRYQARSLLTRGQVLLALERFDEATASLEAAVTEFEGLGMTTGESEAWVALAEVRRQEGDLEGALDRIDRGLVLLDELRGDVGSPDLQSLFLGSRNDHRLRIELLMGLAEAQKDPRRAEEALLTSERWRAIGLRGLLEQVGGFDGVEVTGAFPTEELRDARRTVRLQAARLRRARSRSASGEPQADTEARRLEVELSRSMARVESLEAEGRDRGGSSTPPLDMAGLANAFDADTALLEVVLGRDRGFVFVVTQGVLETFEIPSREVIEGLARRFHGALVEGRPPGEVATELARYLVEPALRHLEGPRERAREPPIRRLAVVADGALHYVPLGALPTTGLRQDRPRPLLERYEIVYLASVSALVAERRRTAGRPPAPHWVAVLADPVFDAGDRRVSQARGEAEGAAGRGVDGVVPPNEALPILRQGLGVELPRLRRSRQEAERVAALAETGEALVALDFDASRELILDGTLADYRVIHFATHGVIDAHNPALSGLALSQVDPEGSKVDGFLGLRDLYGMRLQADLVVLSACQTALGREVRGEGLVGFTQAFLQAGARRVVASLWSVPDHATAELMGRFYGALVERPDAPATALRQAQLSMAAERRWRDPRNWASWVLVGDWRPHRTVDPENR